MESYILYSFVSGLFGLYYFGEIQLHGFMQRQFFHFDYCVTFHYMNIQLIYLLNCFNRYFIHFQWLTVTNNAIINTLLRDCSAYKHAFVGYITRITIS